MMMGVSAMDGVGVLFVVVAVFVVGLENGVSEDEEIERFVL